MNSLAIFVVCIQACLVQNVFSQCLGAVPYAAGLAPAAYAGVAPFAYGLGADYIAPGIAGPFAGYGGSGIGDVTVVGEMPVAGTTLVAGQVPILGAVRFAGDLPAAGTVIITARCGCGCRGNFY